MIAPRFVVGFLLCLLLSACAGEEPAAARAVGSAGRQDDAASAPLASELGCGACHAGMPSPDLVRRRAPELGGDGRRPPASFLFRYLLDPVGQRGDIGRSRMPDFHLDTAEAAALTLFLLERQGTPLPEGEGPGPVRRARRRPEVSAARGERIARALNCAGCHRGTGLEPWAAGPPLGDGATRARPGWLRRWLARPEAVRPYGFRPGTGSRMPDFRLTDAEADTLASELAPGGGVEASRPEPLSPYRAARADALLARRLPCLGCHRLDGEGGRIGPALDGVAARRTADYVLGIVRAPGDHAPGTIMPRVPMPGDRARLVARRLLDLGPDGGGQGGRDAPRRGYLSLVDHPVRPPEAHERRPPAGAAGRAPAEPAGGALYRATCAACHGAGGRARGYNARYLPVRPTPHASADLMARRPDATLFDGIHAGGRILGRSHLMPPFGARLDRERIWSLVRHVRELCGCQGPAWSRDGAVAGGAP